MHILSTNYKGLKKQCPNFIKPGFETKNIQLASNNLFELDVEKQIETISAIPRIQTLDNPKTYLTDTQPRRINSFNALEHLSQSAKLFGSKSEKSHASLWWKTDASWCGELQARQPFRQSALDDDYCLFQPSHASELRWHEKVPKTYPAKYQLTEDIAYKPDVLSLASGVAFWIDVDFEKEIEKWLDKYGGHPEQTAKKLTHISLRKLSSSTEEQWQWHSYLGVYKRLKKDKWSDDE
jgi:CRISPR-associated endonuclease/helicase Cas3